MGKNFKMLENVGYDLNLYYAEAKSTKAQEAVSNAYLELAGKDVELGKNLEDSNELKEKIKEKNYIVLGTTRGSMAPQKKLFWRVLSHLPLFMIGFGIDAFFNYGAFQVYNWTPGQTLAGAAVASIFQSLAAWGIGYYLKRGKIENDASKKVVARFLMFASFVFSVYIAFQRARYDALDGLLESLEGGSVTPEAISSLDILLSWNFIISLGAVISAVIISTVVAYHFTSDIKDLNISKALEEDKLQLSLLEKDERKIRDEVRKKIAYITQEVSVSVEMNKESNHPPLFLPE